MYADVVVGEGCMRDGIDKARHVAAQAVLGRVHRTGGRGERAIPPRWHSRSVRLARRVGRSVAGEAPGLIIGGGGLGVAVRVVAGDAAQGTRALGVAATEHEV